MPLVTADISVSLLPRARRTAAVMRGASARDRVVPAEGVDEPDPRGAHGT
jgi:hypothetical protein